MDIAAAAVKMAHDALGGNEEREIPAFAPVGATAGKPGFARAGAMAGKPEFARAGAAAGEREFARAGATAGKSEFATRVGTPAGEPESSRPGAPAGKPARAFERPQQTNKGDDRPAGRLVKQPDRQFEKRDRNFRKRDRGRDSDGDGERVRLFVGAGRAAGVRPADLVGAITGAALKATKIRGNKVHVRREKTT
jgi:hypothetical protein